MPRLLPATLTLAALTLAALLLTGCDRIQRQRAEQHYQKAVSYHQEDLFDSAIAEYGKAIAISPNTAQYYSGRAWARMSKKQFASALDDANECLRIAPSDPDHLILRGTALIDLGETDAAIADLDKAIAARGAAPAQATRARAFLHKGDFKRALADADAAVRLMPGAPVAYVARADVRMASDDFDGAMADLDKAESLKEFNPRIGRVRSVLHMLLQEWPAAQKELETIADDEHPSQPYFQILLWLCRTRQGQTEAANESLANFRGNHSFGEDDLWPQTLMFFLLGKLAESDLLAAAASPDPKTAYDQRCEALYYAALKRHLTGDEPGAIDLYRQCVATRHYAFYEYRLARAELQHLGKLE